MPLKKVEPWYADFENCRVCGALPYDLNYYQERNFSIMLNNTIGMNLSRKYVDGVILRCAMEREMRSIIEACYFSSIRGHYGSMTTSAKVIQSEFYWPTLYWDSYDSVKACEQCQSKGKSSGNMNSPCKQAWM